MQVPTTLRAAWVDYSLQLQSTQPPGQVLTPAFLEKLFVIYLSGAQSAFKIMWEAGLEENETIGVERVSTFAQELTDLTEFYSTKIEGGENVQH